MSNICTLEQAGSCAQRLKELCLGVEVYLFGDISRQHFGTEIDFALEVDQGRYEAFRDLCQRHNVWVDDTIAALLMRMNDARSNTEERAWCEREIAILKKKKIHWFAKKIDEPIDPLDATIYPLPRTVRTKKALSIFELMERHLKEIAAAGHVSPEMLNVICLPKGWSGDSRVWDALQNEIYPSSEFDSDFLDQLKESAKKFSGELSWG